MAQKRFIIEVEKAKAATEDKPSRGPAYRSIFAKDGFPPPIPGLDSCWDVFRLSVEKYPNNPMLGSREIVDGKHGKYKWQTYKEVYDMVIKVGNSIRSCGYGEGVKCGIYGANSAEWIMSMEACNAHGLHCVPLYDTLGSGAIEFIISHAEVSIAFAEEKKIPELLKTFPNATKYLKTIVSFGKVTPEQKQEVEKFGLAIYSWTEFLQLGESHSFDLPVKKRSDICTIMYTSGTTGDPKGVLISNESIITLLAGVKRLLESVNEKLTEKDVYLSYLPLAHIFDRVIEETFIWHGGSIGFWRGDVKLLIEDLGELKPTIFCAVPRVLDRVYSGLTQKISSGGFLKKTLFNFAYSYKLNNMKKGQNHAVASPLLDKIVFDKVKQGLGGSVRLILSGAAPLSLLSPKEHEAPKLGRKSRAASSPATDAQSIYARKRRERINERLRILQTLVPNGTKVDISTMLEEAVQYVKFLQLQIKLLSSEDMWMYAPIAYNGMNIGLDLSFSSPTN